MLKLSNVGHFDWLSTYKIIKKYSATCVIFTSVYSDTVQFTFCRYLEELHVQFSFYCRVNIIK